MLLGTAVHCAVLEPATFDQRYCLDLDASKNSNAYKAFALECEAQHLTPIAADDRERVFAMRDSLCRNAQIAEALDGPGRSEVSAWWTDPETGVLCKCRPDRVRAAGDGSLLLDLKTTSDASPEAFSKSIANFGYHTQCDWYVDGYARASGKPVHGMLFVVVESEFPYACAAYTLDEAALQQARWQNAQVRRTYKRCSESGIWPGYAEAVTDIGLPRWALTYEEETA
jgi:exodeoxyribonuclease VIII